MNNQTIRISGMTCDACVKLVIRRFMKIPGATSARVMLDGTAHVEASRLIGKEEFMRALEGLPYNVI